MAACGARADEKPGLAARAPVIIGFQLDHSPICRLTCYGAFRQGLAETGWAEGRNLLIEYRWARQIDRLQQFALDLVQHPVMVIVASGGEASASAARAATTVIPIVPLAGADPESYRQAGIYTGHILKGEKR